MASKDFGGTYRTVYLSVALDDQVQALASKQRRSVSQLIRIWCEEGIKKERRKNAKA